MASAAGAVGFNLRRWQRQPATECRSALQNLRELPLNNPAVAQRLGLAGPPWTLYESALRSAPVPDALINVATTSERLFEVMDRLSSLYDTTGVPQDAG